jgi:glycosidase
VNTLPGIPLIYTGEEVANDRKLDLFEKVDVDWSRPRELGDLNRVLFHLRKENKALVQGKMVRLKTKFDNEVYAFARVAGSDAVIAVLSFSSEAKFTPVEIPLKQVFGRTKKISLIEVFDGHSIEIAKETGEQLVVALEPKAYKVFHMIAKP